MNKSPEQLKEDAQQPRIKVADLCYRHLHKLVHGAKYKETDSWQVMVLVAQIAMLQGATANPTVQKKLGGDITKLPGLGCMACFLPYRFTEVIQAAKTHDLGVIKALGEKWVKETSKSDEL